MANNPLRIIFMGTPQFAVPSLQALIDHGEQVVAVISQPDRPCGRGRKVTSPPVKEIALKAGLTMLQPKKIKSDEFLEEIRSYKADLFIVVAYGRILPGPVLDLPPLGTINVHGSLLPNYRGSAPIQWSILNGDQETGVTIMQLDEGMDTGDMLLSGELPIDDDDTTITLSEKMAELGAKLLIEALDKIKENKLPPQKQDESLATEAPPLCKHQSVIDWSKSAKEISCQIRGLDPWPLASTTYNQKWLRLFSPIVVQGIVTEPPGTLCNANKNGLLFATGENYLLIREVQLEGSKRMGAAAFLCGRPLPCGIRLPT